VLGCTHGDDDFQVQVCAARAELNPAGFLPDYWLVYLHRLLRCAAGQLILVKWVVSTHSAPPE
jgi:hypothetical protein